MISSSSLLTLSFVSLVSEYSFVAEQSIDVYLAGSAVTTRFTTTQIAHITTIIPAENAPVPIIFFENAHLLFWIDCVVRKHKSRITVT